MPGSMTMRAQVTVDMIGRGDEGDEIVAGDATINHHHWDALFGGASHNGIKGVGSRCRHDQNVDAALQQVLDVGNLLGRVIVGVRDQQLFDFVLVVRSCLLDRMQHADAPAVGD
jgi:hypothetical protein